MRLLEDLIERCQRMTPEEKKELWGRLRLYVGAVVLKKYTLASQADVVAHAGQSRRALEYALGLHVRRLRYHSIGGAHVGERGSTISPDVKLKWYVAETLAHALETRFAADLLREISDRERSDIRAALIEAFFHDLAPLVGAQCGEVAWDGVQKTLFYMVGFHLAGAKKKAKLLEPLAELLLRCIPLGKRHNDPGVWLVLVA